MKRRALFFIMAMTALVLLVYLPALKSRLIWDSRPMILENDLLRGDFSLGAPFRSGYWATTSQRSDGGYDYYRPLTVLSFMAEKAVWGLSPWRLRLVNLLIFIAALLALYLFLRRQRAPAGVAEAAVILYALFPLHLDNVNWVVGRCDMLLLLFGVLSLLLFDRFLERRSAGAGLLALACFALALLSKEAALFLLPIYPIQEFARKRHLTLPLYLLPLLVAAAFWLLKSAVIGRAGFPIRPFPTLMENVLPVLGTLGYYLRSLVFPFVYDMFLPVDAVQTAPCLAAGALFAAVLALLFLIGLRRPALLQGWSWTVPFLAGSLLLVFTPIHPFSISTRYLTVPAIGWTWLLGHALARLKPWTRKAALVLLIVASAAAVIANSRKFADETAFWKSAIASSPDNSFFLAKYAGQLREEGDFIRGEALLRRALGRRLTNLTAISIALQMADSAFRQARYGQCLDWLEKMRALKLDSLYDRQRQQSLLKVHMARNDLAAAGAVVGELALGLPAMEAAARRIELYLAFGDWRKARLAAAAVPEAAGLSRAIQDEEARFKMLDLNGRARYFADRGNFAAAWELLPGKDDAGIASQLQAARLALLAGREAEGQQRIASLRLRLGGDFRVLNALGNMLFELQRAEEALPLYSLSLRVKPDQPALKERVEWIGASQRQEPAPAPRPTP